MKEKKCWSIIKACALAVTSVALLAGCRNLLVFSTATKFGLDVSESSGQQPEITFGYNRAELVCIPIGAGDTNSNINDAGSTNDAYSVLGTFFVAFDPRIFTFSNTESNVLANPGVHINDLFATGIAAQKAAANPVMGAVFGTNLIEIVNSKTNNSN
jgi:hypothetical protein